MHENSFSEPLAPVPTHNQVQRRHRAILTPCTQRVIVTTGEIRDCCVRVRYCIGIRPRKCVAEAMGELGRRAMCRRRGSSRADR